MLGSPFSLKNMTIYHYLSPLIWSTEYIRGWSAPSGCVLGLDMRSLDAQSLAGEYGDWSTAYVLSENQQTGNDFVLLGIGRVDEVYPSQYAKDAWTTLIGIKPIGSTLLDWIINLGTDQAIIDGSRPIKPFIPTKEENIELFLPLHSKVWTRKFGEWNPTNNKYHNRIRDLLRYDFKKLKKEGLNEYILGKFLSILSKKYKCDPKEIDTDDKIKIQKPTTTITDDFTRGDGDTIGNTLSWTEYHDWDTVSNRAKFVANQGGAVDVTNGGDARAETALSADDHYSQVNVYDLHDWEAQGGSAVRFASGAETFYLHRATLYSSQQSIIAKMVSGTLTNLNITTASPSSGVLVKTDANGSTLTGYFNGSQVNQCTDTAITGNLYCGIYSYTYVAYSLGVDNFEASDGISDGGSTARTARLLNGLLRGGLLKGGRLKC